MSEPTGRFGRQAGRIYFGSDFVGTNTLTLLGPDIQVFGVGTETGANKVDETGGVFTAGTGATDDDNIVLRSGVFSPRDGRMVCNARFTLVGLSCAIFVGFADTLDTTTPVMPAEFATATMTYSGSSVGFNYDLDGTTDDFRAVMGVSGAAGSDSANGIRSNATLTLNRWFETQVIVNEDGTAECWLGEVGHTAGSGTENKMRLIKRFSAGTLISTTGLFFAVLMLEVRNNAGAQTMNVDYFGGEAGRDWRAA